MLACRHHQLGMPFPAVAAAAASAGTACPHAGCQSPPTPSDASNACKLMQKGSVHAGQASTGAGACCCHIGRPKRALSHAIHRGCRTLRSRVAMVEALRPG